MPSNSNVPCFVTSTAVTELSTKKPLSGAAPYSNGNDDRMAASTSSSTCDECCSDACSLAYSTDLRSYINSCPNSQFTSTTSDGESTLNNNDLMSDVAASSTTAPCENAESDQSKSKLVRSLTFTINTTNPYLKSLDSQLQSNFNSSASNSHSAMNLANYSISDVFRRSNTAVAQSPVVSDGITRILQKYGEEFGETLIDYDLIKEQILSLNEMRCMLKEYHRLQLDELKLRQARELQTIETQLSLMENLLNKINLHSSNGEQQIFINQLCETASNDSYYVSLSPTKTLKPRPSLTSEGKSFCHLHQDCLPENVTREFLDNYSSGVKEFSKLTLYPFKVKEKLLALVKGFFIRRLMRTNYVKSLLTAIRDTTAQIDALNKENLLTESDSNFKRSLFYQLQFERFTFYRVFFEISTSERMKIIARDRIRDMAKINTDVVKRNPEPSFKNPKISSATLKRLARKGNANSQTPSVCSSNSRHLISGKVCGRTGWYSQSADDLRKKISKSNGGDSVSMLSIASSRQSKTPHKQKNDRRPWR
ncbi:Centriolar coiled-coil protein [Trichinella pseudospiralis]|uniref:Centriolar coiled-coil protein n=2 Tax=Trichinella pseudospiralis TaxID=6337 RepID=A0A0V1G6K6_TRIPS|nr:Centriolar coiled-coil protein [Trichinella pseudospiralis]KRY93888.1 Centriolar coiled-coil protein [Trichinella pseudospiralis]KRZ33002.1 Centriolar coiled-coil protein [Trichinella pseudospiralis]KRZ44495.1 Centriolar coiled-coil protein [Trichinella pseudospiralis]